MTNKQRNEAIELATQYQVKGVEGMNPKDIKRLRQLIKLSKSFRYLILDVIAENIADESLDSSRPVW
jgi:hypothetical protein